MLWLLLGCVGEDPGKDEDTDTASPADTDDGDTDTDDTDDTDEPGDTDDTDDSDLPPEAVDAREDNVASGAGDYAADYLSAAAYDRMVVEIDYVRGHEPSEVTLDRLQANIEELCDKPGGVEILLDDELDPVGGAWSYEAAEDLEVAVRDTYHSDDGTAALYFLYLDGHSDADEDGLRILGYAYHGSSLVIFHESIQESEGSVPLGTTVEEVVVIHELGHVLGLVNNGAPMQSDHEDPESRHHDVSDECIMYWAVETSSVVDILTFQDPDFDDACREDMAAVRDG